MAGFMEIDGNGNLYHGNFTGILMGSSGNLMVFCIPENKALVFSLELTASLHLKMDGWNTNLSCWGKRRIFQGRLLLVLGSATKSS